MKSKLIAGLLVAIMAATGSVAPAFARDGHRPPPHAQQHHNGGHHGNHGNHGNHLEPNGKFHNGHHHGHNGHYRHDDDDGDLVKGLIAGAIITGIIVNSNNN